MMSHIVFRAGLAIEWYNANPTLLSGEPGYETDTGLMKIGDGLFTWNALEYADFNPPTDMVSLSEHIQDSTPHSVYDNGPSLVLLYQNEKV